MNQLSKTSKNLFFSILGEYLIEDSFPSFEGRKKRVGSKEKLERDKLQHKIKREMKGAIREIRKDNAFIAREKLKEQIDKYVIIKYFLFVTFYNRLIWILQRQST